MGKGYCAIVVAVDPLQETGNAVAVAAALARSANLPAEMVTVVSPEAADGATGRDLERRIAPHGRAARYVLQGDDPGRGIAEHVANRDGALLVMGTTTWGSSGVDLLDTVAEEVLGQVLEPVLVIGPKHTLSQVRTATPVAVVDGSGIADAAMPVVEEWIRTFPGDGAKVVEVVPPTGVPIPAGDVAGHVRRYVDQLAKGGIAASGEVLRSDEPAAALAAYADDLDDAVLVVTSPRWEGEGSHWFTTTRRLIRYSKRPVLVVPADRQGHGGSTRRTTPATTGAGSG
jgi:nucleotide-binding universal stress UspA family protein